MGLDILTAFPLIFILSPAGGEDGWGERMGERLNSHQLFQAISGTQH
jgi:hypothetical protein